MDARDAPLASRWRRLGGWAADVVVAALVGALLMAMAGLLGEVGVGAGRPAVGLSVVGFGVALYVVLNVWLLATRGQTVGKYFAGTRIVSNETGLPAELHRVLLLRMAPFAVLCAVPRIGLPLYLATVLSVFRSDRRCLHDWAAGTKVVDVCAESQAAELDDRWILDDVTAKRR